MNFEIMLLSHKELGGLRKLDVIKRLGRKCALSDFAILLGAFVPNYHVDADSSLKGRTGWWYLSSYNMDGEMLIVRPDGKRKRIFVSAATRWVGIRPVLQYSNISEIPSNVVRGKSGILEVEYGEYPQYAVDTRLARTLDREFSAGRLRKTGKTYTTDSNYCNSYHAWFEPVEHEEFDYKGKRYVRVYPNCCEGGYKLSNGVKVMDDAVWLEVSPIKWYVDERSRMLVSKTLLASGIRFVYDRDYGENEMYMWLNKYFVKDIIPSNIATDRLKNDFPCDSKLAEEEIIEVKEPVNKQIEKDDTKQRIENNLYISSAGQISDAIFKVHADCNNYKSLDIELRKIKEIAIEAVKMDGLLLKYVLGNLNNDIGVVLAAVSQNPKAIEFAGIECRDNEVIVLEAIKGYPQAIWCASQRIRKNKYLIRKYIYANEDFFKLLVYTNDPDLKEYKYDRDIVIAGISVSGENIMYFPNYYSDREVVTVAFKSLKEKEIAEVISKNLSFDLRDDESIMLVACGVKKECAKEASDRLRSKRSFIERVFPDSKNVDDRIGRVKYSWGDLNNEYLIAVFDLAKAWSDVAVAETKVSSNVKKKSLVFKTFIK